MFQLIVAVIAIALVIALTLASIFYGGEAFTRSSLKANVAAMVNQAQQISGAHTLYKTDYAVSPPGADSAARLNELKKQGYLAEIPTAPKIAATDSNGDVVAWDYRPADKGVYLELGAETDETCKAVALNGAGECQDQNGDAGTEFYAFPL